METLLQVLSTVSIFVLLGITLYLSMPKNRLVIAAVGHILMRWFSFLLVMIAIGRIAVLFDPATDTLRAVANSSAFLLTVLGILWSVVRYERAN